MLNANEGSIINTVTNKSLLNMLLIVESGAFCPEPIKTNKMPIIPKAIDE